MISLPKVNQEWASLPLFDRRGWKRLPFGTFAESVNERVEPSDAAAERYVGLEHLDPRDLHIRRWGSGSDVIGTKLRFRKGDIIFGRRRAYQRKLAVAEFDGICSAHAMVVRARSEAILSELLPFVMVGDRFMKRAVEISVGSLSPTINWKVLKTEPFDIPPLEQQQRLASMLRAIDQVRDEWSATRAALIGQRQAILNAVARESASAHTLRELDSVIEVGRPICYGILKPGLHSPGGIPVIKVKDYPTGSIHEDELLHTTPAIESAYKRSRLKGGDLLISIRGTVGRLAEVPQSLNGANITQDSARLAIGTEHNRDYIRAVLESQFVSEQLMARITGLAVQGINIGELRRVKIPVPPRDVQAAIAGRIKAVGAVHDLAANLGDHQTAMFEAAVAALTDRGHE